MAKPITSDEEREYMVELGDRLKKARQRTSLNYQPLSQEQVSEKTGIDRRTLCNYEKGKSSPNCYRINKIAKALRVKVEWLINGKS